MKISGLINNGKVAPAPGVSASTAFSQPPAATATNSPPTPAVGMLVATGQVRKWRIDQLVDSPYQTRLKKDQARIDEIGQSMKAEGQSTPIEIRIRPDGLGEIVKGHTRRDGARSIGWEEVDVLPREMTNVEARCAVLIDNTGKDPHDYEYGVAFKAALDSGDVKTQAQLGTMLGFPQPKISKCLQMLKLPAPIIALLDESPGLFSVTTADQIFKLWDEYPEHSDIIVQGVRRFKDGAAQAGLKAWVVQQILHAQKEEDKNKNEKHPPESKRFITHNTGDPAYITMTKKRDITIRLSDTSLDIEETRAAVEEFLRKRVEQGESK